MKRAPIGALFYEIWIVFWETNQKHIGTLDIHIANFFGKMILQKLSDIELL